jgi:hypothetical protein
VAGGVVILVGAVALLIGYTAQQGEAWDVNLRPVQRAICGCVMQ